MPTIPAAAPIPPAAPVESPPPLLLDVAVASQLSGAVGPPMPAVVVVEGLPIELVGVSAACQFSWNSGAYSIAEKIVSTVAALVSVGRT
jgi:hypothetical protein